MCMHVCKYSAAPATHEGRQNVGAAMGVLGATPLCEHGGRQTTGRPGGGGRERIRQLDEEA